MGGAGSNPFLPTGVRGTLFLPKGGTHPSWWGYPSFSTGGIPIPGQDGGGYPIQNQDGGYSIPGQDRGYHPRSRPWSGRRGGGSDLRPTGRYASCVHAGGLSCYKLWIIYYLETGTLSLALDGSETSCLKVPVLGPDELFTALGELTFMKDVSETRMVVEISYNTDITDCNSVRVVHYCKVVPECSFLKVAPRKTGSTHTGSKCRYVVECNRGNVTCNVEFAITDGNGNFSLCEIEM